MSTTWIPPPVPRDCFFITTLPSWTPLWCNYFSCTRRRKKKKQRKTLRQILTWGSLHKRSQTSPRACVWLSPRQELLARCENLCKQRDRQLLFCQLDYFFILNMCSMFRTLLTLQSEGRAWTFISFRRDFSFPLISHFTSCYVFHGRNNASSFCKAFHLMTSKCFETISLRIRTGSVLPSSFWRWGQTGKEVKWFALQKGKWVYSTVWRRA